MQFLDDFPFAGALLKYVEHISGENRWFIDECIDTGMGEYWAIFKSYLTPEFRNFILSIRVVHSDSGWDFSVHKQVTELA